VLIGFAAFNATLFAAMRHSHSPLDDDATMVNLKEK
jgi:hypothetical protein